MATQVSSEEGKLHKQGDGEGNRTKVARQQSRRFSRYKNTGGVSLTFRNAIVSLGIPAIIHENQEDSTTGLLRYFKTLTQNLHEDVDFEKIEELLAKGANINATTHNTQQTVLHDVATNWDVHVAQFLLEKGANIHSTDRSGRTPLHIAAGSDHKEMVVWLLGQGAELEAKTTIEKQTPVYYAARSDSLSTLQVLIQHGGNYKIRDYKGRTPLHLAVDLGRTATAEYLLSLEVPAECCVVDDCGNNAISSMIRTMPRVAISALDQLHYIADRKEYFLLADLEPRPGNDDNLDGIKTPFETAVETGRFDILSHPVMQELAQQKWSRFVKWVFYADVTVYAIFVLSWSLLIAFPSLLEKHKYFFPRDIWRITVEILAVGTYLYQIVEEVTEVIKSSHNHKHYVEIRSQALRDDLNHTDHPDEKKILEYEIDKVNKRPPNYFKDPWNIIDIVTYVILGILILLHAVDIGVHREQLALWTARLSCAGIVLIWVRLLKYARGFLFLGPLISTISHLMENLFRYFIIYMILFIPFVISFWVLFGGVQSEGLEERDDLTKFYRVAVVIFRITLIDDYPYATLRNVDELMAAFLIVGFFLVTFIVGVNLSGKKWPFAIAGINSTFHRVHDQTRALSLLQQAHTIQSYEEKICSCIYQRYLVHIHNKCNPLVLSYSHEKHNTEGTVCAQRKKSLNHIYHMVSKLQRNVESAKQKKDNILQQLESLTLRLEHLEEKMNLVDQYLVEIKTSLSKNTAHVQRNERRVTFKDC